MPPDRSEERGILKVPLSAPQSRDASNLKNALSIENSQLINYKQYVFNRKKFLVLITKNFNILTLSKKSNLIFNYGRKLQEARGKRRRCVFPPFQT